MNAESRLHTTRLVGDLADGKPDAAVELLPVVYEELRALASRYLRRQRNDHTLQPTALVHEAFLKLVDQTQARWKDRAHFFAVAAKAMRQVLINHAEARGAQKRGGGRARMAIHDDLAVESELTFDPVALNDALNRLAALDPRKAQVVELRFFAGLSVDEVAEVLSVSKTTVESDWRLARAWLSRELVDAEPA